MKCIYCLEEKIDDHFTKAEHIIPQAFGVFRNNFTLNNEVCDQCNQYFGDNLEIDLGRDTVEGISRHQLGVKLPKEFKSLGNRSRLSFKVMEGPLSGAYAYLDYSTEINDVILKPLPQVGFLNKETLEYMYFKLDEIPQKDQLDLLNLDYSKNVRFLGATENSIQEALTTVDIELNFTSDNEEVRNGFGEWEVEIEGSLDDKIYRAIAKIAFNYMTYMNGADFVLQKTFNPIRHYIRYGQRAKRVYLLVRNDNILADEDVKQPRLCHIVTLNWAQNRKTIISQVSLFNSFFSYTMQLSKHYRGKQQKIRSGHFFNLGDNNIYELTPLSKEILD